MTVIVIGVGLGIAGCGVPTSDDASTAAAGDVPFGLLESAPSTTTTLPELSSTTARVWLVAGERISPVTREVVAPATVDRLIASLVDGPSDAEATLGLRSAAAAETIGAVELVNGVVILDLEPDFTAGTPREQLLALAQLVFTLTELDTVEVVTFTLAGQPIDVPRADGSISDGPVTRLDYATLES